MYGRNNYHASMLRQEGARDLEEREERERMYGRDNYHASMLKQEGARDLEERERMHGRDNYHASMLRQEGARDLEEREERERMYGRDNYHASMLRQEGARDLEERERMYGRDNYHASMLRQEGARDLEEREERERMYEKETYHASMLRQESARDLEKREERERMYEWEKYHASMLRQKVERDLEEVEMKGNGWKNDTSYLMFKERLKRDMGLRDLVVEWRRWRNHYFAKKLYHQSHVLLRRRLIIWGLKTWMLVRIRYDANSGSDNSIRSSARGQQMSRQTVRCYTVMTAHDELAADGEIASVNSITDGDEAEHQVAATVLQDQGDAQDGGVLLPVTSSLTSSSSSSSSMLRASSENVIGLDLLKEEAVRKLQEELATVRAERDELQQRLTSFERNEEKRLLRAREICQRLRDKKKESSKRTKTAAAGKVEQPRQQKVNESAPSRPYGWRSAPQVQNVSRPQRQVATQDVQVATQDVQVATLQLSNHSTFFTSRL
ncbi:hypothetical protein CAPTEDRAFT_185048 [Capitella teleta]|uniref:Uncharacterized protein n=1 Tax=Capitella teleta TaxID=283909 RepID=R7VII1_CAPTE|nr:hypothetical protein CAPTEDRAFT_185048 [Capitella teleta]|eukprot:ELU18429.1 hypothetical protein CAPTEDRAFT_185048 [Capitella teleta]